MDMFGVCPLLTGSDKWKLEGMRKSKTNDTSRDFGRYVHGSVIYLAEDPRRWIDLGWRTRKLEVLYDVH